MGAWTIEATFFLVVATVQLALGLAIIVRRARIEWAAILGALFCLNAALSVNALLVELGAYSGSGPNFGFEQTGSRIVFVFDRMTTLLVGYLALAYPRRPSWAASRPWLLPTLFALLAASILVPFALGVPYVHFVPGPFPLCDQASCPVATWFNIWTQVVLSLGVPLLLVRWALILPRLASPLELAHLRVLFAAFAVRAVHVELDFHTRAFLTGYVYGWSGRLTGPSLAFVLRGGVAALALVAFAIQLLRARRRGASDVRRAASVVLGFATLGAAEAALTLTVALPSAIQSYFYAAFLQLDLVLLRPALVLYGAVRHDLFGPFFLGPRAAAFAVRSLAFAVVFVGVALGLGLVPAPQGAILVAAALAALVLAAAASAALRPFLSGSSSVAGRSAASVPVLAAYLASLEEAYRNGPPSAAGAARLAETRGQLGLEEAPAAALEGAVRTRWAGTVGPHEWQPGETLAGRYRIEARLGEGGSAEAYLATDLVGQHSVVLKRTRRLDPATRRALVREAQHLSRLRHPGIVRLEGTEALGDETILVLEHLEGGSLHDRLAAGPLGPQEAERLARDVLEGLAAAHQAGLLHRDIKPSNVLFAADGRAKLADFGSAGPTSDARAAPLVEVTQPGAGEGSLRYMSPEQVQGQRLDARSDLFSLGLLLAEATGGEPLPGLPATDYEVRRAIVEGPPPRLPPLPRRLAAAISAATERDPRRRPASAAAMLAML